MFPRNVSVVSFVLQLKPYNRYAAQKEHSEMLKWLNKNGCPYKGDRILTVAASNDDFETFKWALENETTPFARLAFFKSSAARGNLEMVKLAIEKGLIPDERCDSSLEAANRGFLEFLKLAHQNGFPVREEVCAFGAMNYHLDVLKWATKEANLPLREDVCMYAAKEGHLELIQWAREAGCPWNHYTTTYKLVDYSNYSID